jgi:hypothetical protein
MTVDGEPVTGGGPIIEKISKFIGCTFEVQTVRASSVFLPPPVCVRSHHTLTPPAQADILPATADGSMFLSFVGGAFRLPGETNALLFTR